SIVAKVAGSLNLRGPALHVERFIIQRMKTKWGGSSLTRRTIRLNLEFAKKDAECFNYVILSIGAQT
ncbi:MAG TPA: YgjP-like metallopeptidase domain-containing protein, partial [Pararhizobium sp.]|nr:YgjP-like metallopeptidase domain-containing protein [Pararhizobium sp.]